MATDVAIDIGTASTRLATHRGVIFNEPTLVAIDTSNGDVVDVGHGALDLIGRTPRHVAVFRPLAQPETLEIAEEIVVVGIAVVAGSGAS